MGEATRNRYNPVYNHLVSLQQECQEKEAPSYVKEGINRALKLMEVTMTYDSYKRARMSSKFGQIQSGTTELAALEHLKKPMLPLFLVSQLWLYLGNSQARDEYCETASSVPSDPLAGVAAETRAHPWTQLYKDGKTLFNQSPVMLTGALEGKLLQMLVSMQKAKKILEIGMYTGYSALTFAEVLPDDGEVVTCDIDPYLKEFAERSFARSPHGQKIKIRLGDARETLHQLVKEKQSFDIIFLDADKPSYKEYYKTVMDNGLLNKGGTILFDNALFYGQVYSEDRSKERTPNGCGVRECEDFIKTDQRVQRVLVPVRDGLLIVRRKEDMEQ